jgi:hypothetical protein
MHKSFIQQHLYPHPNLVSSISLSLSDHFLRRHLQSQNCLDRLYIRSKWKICIVSLAQLGERQTEVFSVIKSGGIVFDPRRGQRAWACLKILRTFFFAVVCVGDVDVVESRMGVHFFYAVLLEGGVTRFRLVLWGRDAQVLKHYRGSPPNEPPKHQNGPTT